jgi:alanyl-tRNA synthetase
MSTLEEAKNDNVLMFFGDKYLDPVRVVEVNSVVPRFSAELCGGTHCHRTGDVGAVVITGESSIGSGLRRIEALTGRGAEDYVRRSQGTVLELARKLGVPRESVPARVDALITELETQRKKVEKLERSIASGPSGGGLLDQAVDVDGVRVVAVPVEATSIDALRYHADAAKKSLPDGVAVFGAVIGDQPYFVAMASEAPRNRGVHAGNLIKVVAGIAGGGGGGRPDMAQGGGKDPSKVADALAAVPDAVREMLSNET